MNINHFEIKIKLNLIKFILKKLQVVEEHAGESVLFAEEAEIVQETAQHDSGDRGVARIARRRRRHAHDLLPRTQSQRPIQQRCHRRNRRNGPRRRIGSFDVVAQLPQSHDSA